MHTQLTRLEIGQTDFAPVHISTNLDPDDLHLDLDHCEKDDDDDDDDSDDDNGDHDHNHDDDPTSRDWTVLDLSFESSPSTSCSGRPVRIVASTWLASGLGS